MSLAKEILKEARELEVRLRALSKKAVLASEEEDRWGDIAEALNALDGAMRAAKDAYSQYEAVGIAQLPHEITIDGGTTLTRRESTPRKKWDHQGLGKEVAHRIYTKSFDFETGEMLKGIEELILEMLKYTGVSYWRMKELAKLGISPDKYSEPSEPKTSIQISHPK
jgi:hypothetical protein